jgi:hypothetical protein
MMARFAGGLLGWQGRSSLKLMVSDSAESRWSSSNIIEGRPMDHYAGIDVSLEYSSIWVVDAFGPDGYPQVITRESLTRPWPIKGEWWQVRNRRLLLR